MRSSLRVRHLVAGCILAAAGIVSATGATHAGATWLHYNNKASSYTINYPASWQADHSHKDGTDFSVQSTDGEAYVGVVALADAHPSTPLKAIDLAGLQGGGKMLSKPSYSTLSINGTTFQAASAF